MPELPEVEEAMLRLRSAIEGKKIARLQTLHPSFSRQLPAASARRLRQQVVERVERRGKHQLIHLGNKSILHAHFRMNGDWLIQSGNEPVHKFTRALIELTDGTRIELNDSRALSALTLHAAGTDPLPDLGPEANDDSFDAAQLARALKSRRIAIKPALMDQRIVAGIGNIYAAEALWRARISPTAVASSVSKSRLARLVAAIKAVIGDENRPPGRYTDTDGRERFEAYDREGKPCSRCGSSIARIAQAGRSTYYCAKCQRT